MEPRGASFIVTAMSANSPLADSVHVMSQAMFSQHDRTSLSELAIARENALSAWPACQFMDLWMCLGGRYGPIVGGPYARVITSSRSVRPEPRSLLQRGIRQRHFLASIVGLK